MHVEVGLDLQIIEERRCGQQFARELRKGTMFLRALVCEHKYAEFLLA